MVPRPLPSDEKPPASTDEAALPETEKEPLASAAVRVMPDKAVAPRPSEDDDDDEGDEALALEDDEEDEDLVVFTAKEAAGALATIWAFIKPYLANYKKILAFVALGVVIETLFNVIMPLSLKFLIDDALGGRGLRGSRQDSLGAGGGRVIYLDRRGLVRTLGRTACGGADLRCAHAPVRSRAKPAGGLFRAHPARRDPVALLGRSLGVRRRGEKLCQQRGVALPRADRRHHPDAVPELAACGDLAPGVSNHADRSAHPHAESRAGQLRAEAQRIRAAGHGAGEHRGASGDQGVQPA